MYLLGYDIGSSSTKAAIVEVDTGRIVKSSHYPKTEMPVISHQAGWAEQHPEDWWDNVVQVTHELAEEVDISEVKAIGLSYQMHGLVLVDALHKALRPSIIWSDSRAVPLGEAATSRLGEEKCLSHLLNSPGNFTATKLKWVQENEPEIYANVHKFMLPGDFIAMKMTDEISTTIQGLSEGILWDYKENQVADFLLNDLQIDPQLVPDLVPCIGTQGRLSKIAAEALGLKEGTPVAYRAGDQPNNAMTMGVTEPGEVAASGGTSGVVYAVMDKPVYDHRSRVNGFAHINHTAEQNRIGVLLCINGAGSQYAWIKNTIAEGFTYQQMEAHALKVPIGAEGLKVFPFGNGAERMLDNKKLGAQIANLQFNQHGQGHIFRATLEGIAFSFVYGIEILKELGISPSKIRVGDDNLFQSEIFSKTIATLVGSQIEVIHSTGAAGAARAAGVGCGLYSSLKTAPVGDTIIKTYAPDDAAHIYQEAYDSWNKALKELLD
ncbi:MAG: FGGY family carbohydrate kinase [Bacteroidota bacterium]